MARISHQECTAMQNLTEQHQRMINEQLIARNIHNPKLIYAFQRVQREAFVPSNVSASAYDDLPLPIGNAQTISQPYIVAVMLDALELTPHDRALEVGAGSGYAAALMSRLTAEVYAIERIAELADASAQRLRRLDFSNVFVRQGDGSLGWPEHAPYNAILVSAGGPKVPPALLAQLAIGGRCVVPVGPDENSQELIKITRESDTDYRRSVIADVRFVPLIGEQGWH